MPIYATYIIIYRLHFWSKFSPMQGIQTMNYRFFHSLFTPPGTQNSVLSSNSIHTDRQMYRGKWLYVHAPFWSYTPPIPKTVQIWLKWFQNEDKHMVPWCMRAMISMSTRSSTCLPEHGNLPKCHILSSIIFGRSSDLPTQRTSALSLNNIRCAGQSLCSLTVRRFSFSLKCYTNMFVLDH